MKYKIILCTALLLAAGFSAPAHRPYDSGAIRKRSRDFTASFPVPTEKGRGWTDTPAL